MAKLGPCLDDHFRPATVANACGRAPGRKLARAKPAKPTRPKRAPGRMASMFAAAPRAYQAPARQVRVEIVGAPRSAFSEAEARQAARAIGAPARGIPVRALARGMTAELEHGRRAGPLDVTHDRPVTSARIALAHMREDPRYYSKLARIEGPVRQLPAPAKSRRAKPKREKRPRVDVRAIESAVEQLEADPIAVPQPIAPPGYRPRECASDSPEWGPEYQEALESATERAAIEAGEDEAEFRRLLRVYFEEHPRFSEWSKIERTCVADFRRRHPRKRRRTTTSSSETMQAIEEASREAGYDVRGSAEHLDRLTLGSQAAYWRRVYKKTRSADALRRARELESRNRAAKRKGAGVATHRAG